MSTLSCAMGHFLRKSRFTKRILSKLLLKRSAGTTKDFNTNREDWALTFMFEAGTERIVRCFIEYDTDIAQFSAATPKKYRLFTGSPQTSTPTFANSLLIVEVMISITGRTVG